MRKGQRQGPCSKCGGPRAFMALGDQLLHRSSMTREEFRRYRGITRPPTIVLAGQDRRKLHPNPRAPGWIAPDDAANPISPQPLTTAGPQPWHEIATWLREECGLTVRQCAAECGVGFGPMQRFLNPESKAKAKARQGATEKAKRRNDPDWAQASRDYRRKYVQAKRSGRAPLAEASQTR